MKIVLKGGEGSGHKGHVGRQGIQGGSLPGHPTYSAAGISTTIDPAQGSAGMERARKILGVKRVDDPTLKSYISQLYDYTSEGLTSKVTWINVEPGGRVIVEGAVLDDKGRRAGSFRRVMDIDDNTGERVVFHDGFELLDAQHSSTGIDYRNNGFGSTFFQFSEDMYIKKGFDRIDVHAGMDVGGYAWARLGFDFTSNWMWKTYDYVAGVNRQLVMNIKSSWKIAYPGVEVPDFKHAWEWAMLTVPTMSEEDFEFGKYNMLGTEWYGSKNIRPGSFQLIVGDLYYQAKREERRSK